MGIQIRTELTPTPVRKDGSHYTPPDAGRRELRQDDRAERIVTSNSANTHDEPPDDEHIE